MHRGQPLGRGDVHLPQVFVGAGGGLVDMEHSHPSQQLAHPGQERLFEQAGGAAAYTGDEPDRAGNLYRLLARQLPRYATATPGVR